MCFELQVSIDGHKLIVLGLESCEIEPVEVDTVYLIPGERINVLVNMTQTPGISIKTQL